MSNWPHPQEINEAVQMPRAAFTDPDLRDGEVVTGPTGLPMPFSGNFADVYHIRGHDGREWAVKCFTRPVQALGQRYAAIDRYLAEAKLPFTVGFSFLEQGMRVNGRTMPIVKMPWVDGEQVHNFVRANLGRATVLEALLTLWVRMCRRLRETGMAHCDLQHGNVLMVPGANRSLQLKLVDYDGMHVPELAGKPTIETGHAGYQHPERVAMGIYSADLDRFPHLVVATAMRGLLVGGQGLWQRYDNGDNLLFTEADFQHPAQSKLLHELWNSGDPFLMGMVTHLLIATTRPMSQTPWLDLLIPEGRPPAVTPRQEAEAAHILGLAPPVTAGSSTTHPVMAKPVAKPAIDPFATLDEQATSFRADKRDSEPTPARRVKPKPKRSLLPILIGAGVLGMVLLGAAGLILALSGDSDTTIDPDPDSVAILKPNEQPPKIDTPPKVDPPPKIDTPTPVDIVIEADEPLMFRKAWTAKAETPGKFMLKLSPDGKFLLRIPVDNGGTIDVLDVTSGKLVSQFRDHATPPVVGINAQNHAFSVEDGELVMTVWDLPSGRPLGRVPMPDGSSNFERLDVGNDGRYALLTRSQDAVLLDFDNDGKVVPGFDNLKAGQVVLNPQGDAIATVTDGKDEIEIRGLPGSVVKNETIPAPWNNAQNQQLCRWTGDLLIHQRTELGKNRRQMTVFDPRTKQTRWSFDYLINPKQVEPRLLVSGDNRTLVMIGAGGVDGSATQLTISSKDDWSSQAARTIFESIANDVVVTPTADHVMVQGNNGATVGYDIVPADNTMVNNVPTPESPEINGFTQEWNITLDEPTPGQLSISPDGRRLARVTQNDSGIISIIDADNGKLINEYRNHVKPPLVDFGKADVLCSIADDEESLTLSNAVNGESIAQIALPKGGSDYEWLQVDAAGKFALLRRHKMPPIVINLAQREVVPGLDDLYGGKTLLDAAGEQILNCDDPADRFEIRPLPGGSGQPRSIEWENNFVGRFDQWSNDQRWLAYRVWYNKNKTMTCNVADLETKSKHRVYKSLPQTSKPCFRFSSDGSVGVLYLGKTNDNPGPMLLAFRSSDWQTPVAEFPLDFRASDIALSPDGKHVIVHGTQGELASYAVVTTGKTMMAKVPPKTNPKPKPKPKPMVTDKRLPIPTDDELRTAVEFLQNRYRREYDKRTRPDRYKLVTILLKEAERLNDDATTRYALYTEAESLGIALRDGSIIVQAVKPLTEQFQVDTYQRLAEPLRKLAKSSNKLTQAGIITAAALEAESALDEHDFTGARKLYEAALTALKRSTDVKTSASVAQRYKSIDAIEQRYQEAQQAKQTLQTEPDSADAHLALGRQLCFDEHDWVTGLPHLAQGSNALLRQLAEQERSSRDPVKLGVAWKEASKSLPEEEQQLTNRRARYWLSRAAEGTVGINRERIAEKIRFRDGRTQYEPGLELTWRFRDNIGPATRGKALTSNIDFTGDYFSNNQLIPADKFASVEVVWQGIIYPPHPGRYTLRFDSSDECLMQWDDTIIYAVTREMRRSLPLPNTVQDRVVFDEPIELAARWSGYSNSAYRFRLLLVNENGQETPIPPEWFYHKVK